MSSRSSADPQDLRIETRSEGGAVVVMARGEVTVFSSPALREALRKVAERRPALVVLDLAETPYLDSSGVATFVEALQMIQRGKGKLVLAGMTPRVRGVFEIARLDTIFTVAESVAEALRPSTGSGRPEQVEGRT
jgi:anti-sigma B factor antagonist